MPDNIKILEGGVTAPKGFQAASAAAGIKYKGRTDMALIYSDAPCVTAGVYTTNVVKAAPVLWDKAVTDSDKKVRAVVVNSGIANACTGKQGLDICRVTEQAVTDITGDSSESVLVGSTGVIGMKIDPEKITAGVKELMSKKAYGKEAGTEASKAIMTTDTVNKEIAVSFEIGGKTVTVGAMSKGSGMIHPNMCTMLGYVTTDAVIEKKLLQEALSDVVKDTFNMITVDGDTSTNDTLLVLANGLAEPHMSHSKMNGIAGCYAFFQWLMPMIGWICIHTIVTYFTAFEKIIPWIALLLLLFIGGKMLLEGIKDDDEGDEIKTFNWSLTNLGNDECIFTTLLLNFGDDSGFLKDLIAGTIALDPLYIIR